MLLIGPVAGCWRRFGGGAKKLENSRHLRQEPPFLGPRQDPRGVAEEHHTDWGPGKDLEAPLASPGGAPAEEPTPGGPVSDAEQEQGRGWPSEGPWAHPLQASGSKHEAGGPQSPRQGGPEPSPASRSHFASESSAGRGALRTGPPLHTSAWQEAWHPRPTPSCAG